MSQLTTAVIEASSLALSFGSPDISAGEAISFLDPLTTINISMVGDGNGNWKTTISCSHPSKDYNEQDIKVGDTLPIAQIGNVLYSVAFSNEPGKRIFSAIRVTITGIESS